MGIQVLQNYSHSNGPPIGVVGTSANVDHEDHVPVLSATQAGLEVKAGDRYDTSGQVSAELVVIRDDVIARCLENWTFERGP